ncbi:MAG: ATP-binding cassette domain-containing protein [Firmicutes bacterium]|nr:ATP-binding cassette domain-containing protein [Bacillota bacterium]
MSHTPVETQHNDRLANENGILLQVENIKKYFTVKGEKIFHKHSLVHALDGVSFYVNKGETFGLVGESGSGKTTAGRVILRLIEPTSGDIYFENKHLLSLTRKEMKNVRRQMQMVFQDPYASLNPRMAIGDIIAEPLEIHGVGNRQERKEIVESFLEVVGLQSSFIKRYPHEFSGGQRQRVGIARALVLQPKLIICDEPVSALDISVQSQILNLLKELQEKFSLTYIFIAHGLDVIRYISDRVGVMYLGKIVEIAPTENLFSSPCHPYTESLLSAIPIPNPLKRKKRIILQGDIPSPINPPPGCRFHTRCRYAQKICREVEPEKQVLGQGEVWCHFPLA